MFEKLTQLHRLILRLETGLLIGILLTTIIFAVLQIFLRNVFSSGIIWADTMVRILVLWLGLFGAMYASRRGKHIRIDFVSTHLPAHIRKQVQRLVDVFSAVVCILVTWYSLSLIAIEYEDGTIAFASVPVWLCESIIPFAFAVMAVRYIISAITGQKEPATH